VIPDVDPQRTAEFEGFVRESEPRLRCALVAAYGFEEGRDATAEAFAYAWEHWERVRQMPNAAPPARRLSARAWQSRGHGNPRADSARAELCWRTRP
jgi:hypothetical protein